MSRARFGRGWRSIVFTASLVGALFMLTACGDDDSNDPSDSGGSTTLAPEDIQVSDAEVTAGLAQLETRAAAVTDPTSAQAVEDQWKKIEGTIKAKEPDLYLRFEESIDALLDAGEGDDADRAAAVDEASKELRATADEYRKKHP